jgi:hypothetical protein
MAAASGRRIIGGPPETPLSHDDLLSEIHALIAKPSATGDATVLERIEETLTVGYARALALEAERWRLERRLGEVAAAVGEGGTGTDELGALARRMSDADGDLVRLRAALASLRDRASALRSAA